MASDTSSPPLPTWVQCGCPALSRKSVNEPAPDGSTQMGKREVKVISSVLSDAVSLLLQPRGGIRAFLMCGSRSGGQGVAVRAPGPGEESPEGGAGPAPRSSLVCAKTPKHLCEPRCRNLLRARQSFQSLLCMFRNRAGEALALEPCCPHFPP